MRILVSFILLFGFASVGIAQVSNPLEFPLRSGSMPAWARFLYETPANMHHIDSAYSAYYQSHSFEKDAYVRFYIHWRHSVEPFIRPDGSIAQPNARELELERRPQKTNGRSVTAGPTWQALTMKTCFPGNDSMAYPWQANIYGFDVSKSNPNILVCGTEPGGIYRSVDKGNHWNMIGKDYSLGTEAISIHPTDPNIIYVGTGTDIRKSADAGATWRTVYSKAGNYIYALLVHPTKANVVLACTASGFERSTDEGATWSEILSGTDCSLAVNPATPSTLYTLLYNSATVSYECWKSVDFGATFQQRVSGWAVDSANGGGRLAVSAADPDRVYCILLTAKGPRMMRSLNDAENWSVTASGNSTALGMDNWQGWYDLGILVSQRDANEVIVGTGSTYESTDGGQTFTIIGGYGGNFPLHPDFQDAHAIGNDSWIATDGGLSYSSDCFADLANYSCRMTGIDGSDFWGFDAGWNEDLMVGGRYHNGNTAYYEKYKTFMRLGGAESPTGYVNPIIPRLTYFSDIGSFQLPEKFNGTFGTIAMSKYPNESYFTLWSSRIVWDPRCYNMMWLGSKNSLWRSVDGGTNFIAKFTDPDTSAWVEHIEISRSNPDVMYITSHDADATIYRTSDGGTSWKSLPRPKGLAAGECRISQIALSGTNENEIWWALQSGSAQHRIFHSVDAGATWTNLTTPTIESIYVCDMIHQMGTNGGIYLAGSGVMYYRNNAMSDWANYGSGLPLVHTTRALRPFYRDGKIRAGSNLGIWEAPLYEPSKPLAQPTVDKRLSQCPRDTFYFDDYSVLEQTKASWRWEFPGASFVSSATARNPKVVYAAAGKYTVKLTIAQGSDTSSKTVPNMVEVGSNYCGFDSSAGLAADLSMDSTDFITVPPLPLKTNRFTIMCWVKPKGIQPDWASIFQFDGASGIGFKNGRNEFEFHWNGNEYWWNSGIIIPPDVWSHVAMVVTPDSTTLYLNGFAASDPTANDSVDFSTAISRIGQDRTFGSQRNYDGLVDELAIYDRSLSSDEIRKAIHLVHHTGEPGLQLYYQFDEPTNTETYDRVGLEHATGSLRRVSTAPVARGTSDLEAVRSGKAYDFGSTGLELRTAPASDTLSHEVCAYRLFGSPDSLPFGPKRFTEDYWIVRSWDSIAGHSNDTLAFTHVGSISGADSADLARNFTLYSRGANEDLRAWALLPNRPLQDFASIANSLWFEFADSAIASGQFIIGNSGTSTLETPLVAPLIYSNDLRISPNPSTDRIVIYYTTEHDQTATKLVISDILGHVYEERVLIDRVRGSHTATLELSHFADGAYVIRLGGRSAMIVKD